ncbi:MAG: transposase [Gemmatimonadetes bacterium]|jgi:transposase|nr:transposase [Gemmatimonadota bacterium]
MEIIGLDLPKRESQLSIKADDGTITDRRISTSRDRFTAVFGERPRARILLEASTESEWVARHLESLGHEVIVADPNYAPMYANRLRRTKTDKREARTLMDACETGAWRPAYRLSEARRHVRAELAVRDALVRTRTRYIALAKALVRRDGLRVPTSARAWMPARIAELDQSPTLTTEWAPLFAVFAPLNAQIGVADAHIAAFVKEDPIALRLTTAPGVGPVTARAFVATIDDIARFRSAHELEAVPRPDSERARFGGKAPARPHYQSGQRAHALVAGRSGVANPALEVPGDRRVAGVDRADRAAARETYRGGRARGPRGGHPLRDVAGRRAAPRATTPSAYAGGTTARGVAPHTGRESS